MAIENAVSATALYGDYARLSSTERKPVRLSILRIRHLLKGRHIIMQNLTIFNSLLAAKGHISKHGTVIEVTLIAAPG